MRGYCGKCKEFRSDNGVDAWAIVWKEGNPTCERCGGFVDLNYFVNTKSCKNCRKIYPDNGRPMKFPEITREKSGDRATVAGHMLFVNLLRT